MEVIGGQNKGQLGYVSDVNAFSVQVTTGDDKYFNVRKTSLRLLAPAVAAAVNGPDMAGAEVQGVVNGPDMAGPEVQGANDGDQRVDYHRIIQLIDRVGHILRHGEITLTQWMEINIMVGQLFGAAL